MSQYGKGTQVIIQIPVSFDKRIKHKSDEYLKFLLKHSKSGITGDESTGKQDKNSDTDSEDVSINDDSVGLSLQDLDNLALGKQSQGQNLETFGGLVSQRDQV